MFSSGNYTDNIVQEVAKYKQFFQNIIILHGKKLSGWIHDVKEVAAVDDHAP